MDLQKPNIPIFFILGRGRSGTTLLKSLLDSHPNIIIPFESRFVQYLHYKFGKEKKWNNKKINRFYQEIINCIEAINVDPINLQDQLLQQKSNVSFSDLCKIVYQNIKPINEKQNILMIGDKNPKYAFFLPVLLKLFPEAKFIHITRDYHDNILSFLNIKNVKIESRNIVKLASKWKLYNQQIEKCKTTNPNKFIHLRYEDLVQDPENELKTICTFLSVEYKTEMLNFHQNYKNTDVLNDPYMENMHKNLLSPISKHSVNKWKTEMKAKDIQKAEFIAGAYARKYAYEMRNLKFTIFFRLICFPNRVITQVSLSLKKWIYRSSCIMNTYYYFYKILR